MSESTVVDRERVEERLTAVRTTVRTERRRTVAERRAFEAFADRLADIDFRAVGPQQSFSTTGQGATVAPSATAVAPRNTAPMEAVRRAYEETVMAVSFYEAEYGDDYAESLHAEFGPEVATAVTDPDCFGPAANGALLAAVRCAIRERQHLVETCTRERAAADAAAETLLPVAAELDTVAAAADPTSDPFGTLEARWTRLSTLCDRCEAAAAERQAAIDDRRSRHDLPVEEPDVCAYLYADHEAFYPVLSICASLAERARTLRERDERALARY